MPKLLIFGYGNLSRGDDALGPLLLERLEARRLPGVECLTDYQLQPEHALDIEGRDLILFVDAHLHCASPFEFAALRPARDASFTTHAMSPQAVLQVYLDLHDAPPPPAFLLSVRGERFELGEALTPQAEANLEAAGRFADALCARLDANAWYALSDSDADDTTSVPAVHA